MKPHDSDLDRLSRAQRAALDHVHAVVHRAEVAARARVINLLACAGCAADTYAEAMERLRLHARVVVHFHPDRLGPRSTSVAEALLDEGVYRNQFEPGCPAEASPRLAAAPVTPGRTHYSGAHTTRTG